MQGRNAFYGEAGTGPTLVFLHGWGLGHHSYKRTLKRLVRDLGLRVLAPALPGFGGTSDLPQEAFSMEGYADWVADFLDASGVTEPVLLVGHSFGGGVGIATAHRHPERVRCLVLVNSIGGSQWAKGRALRDRPLWDWGIHFPEEIVMRGRVLPVVLEDVTGNVLRNPLAFWRVGNLARRADLTAELAELKERKLPVVVLWGQQDKIVTEESFHELCVVVGTEGEVIEGAHAWLLSDPDAFGQVMTNVVQVATMANRRRETERKARRSRGASAAG